MRCHYAVIYYATRTCILSFFGKKDCMIALIMRIDVINAIKAVSRITDPLSIYRNMQGTVASLLFLFVVFVLSKEFLDVAERITRLRHDSIADVFMRIKEQMEVIGITQGYSTMHNRIFVS